MKQETVFMSKLFGIFNFQSLSLCLNQPTMMQVGYHESKWSQRDEKELGEKKMNARESPNTYAPLLLPTVGLALSV